MVLLFRRPDSGKSVSSRQKPKTLYPTTIAVSGPPPCDDCAARRASGGPTLDHLIFTLLNPHTLQRLPIRDIVVLSALTRTIRGAWKDVAREADVWQAMCVSLAGDAGLYVCPTPYGLGGWRQYFMTQLWPARYKWAQTEAEQDFEIKVAVRFRPGFLPPSPVPSPVIVPSYRHRPRGGAPLRAARAPLHNKPSAPRAMFKTKLLDQPCAL